MRNYLEAKGDTRTVSAETALGYFGATINETSLVPTGDAIQGQLTLAEFLHREVNPKQTETV